LKATAHHPARVQAVQLKREAARRGHARTRTVMDLIWKTETRSGTWIGTLRNEPSVVVAADSAEELERITVALTVAILEGRGREALRTLTAVNAA